MRIIFAAVAALLLCGCSTWQGMDKSERRMVIGMSVAAVVVGAALNNGDDISHIHQGDTFVTCSKHCGSSGPLKR